MKKVCQNYYSKNSNKTFDQKILKCKVCNQHNINNGNAVRLLSVCNFTV